MPWEPNGHSGLTPSEKRIMDLHDEGMTPEQIVAKIGVRRAKVKHIISMYDASPAIELRHAKKMRKSSAALIRALKSEGQVLHG